MFTAPPMVLRPNSVPCGPRSTSTRCEVDGIHDAADRAAEINAVQIHRRARIAEDREIVLADAADEDCGVVCAAAQRRRAVELHVRHELRHRIDAGGRARFQRFACQRRHGHRRRLQTFLAPARRDGDLLEGQARTLNLLRFDPDCKHAERAAERRHRFRAFHCCPPFGIERTLRRLYSRSRNARIAFCFRIRSCTSGLKPASWKSFIQRSGVISG